MPETTNKRPAATEANNEPKKMKSVEITKVCDRSDVDIAKLGISLIDNTSLDLPNETEESIKALCKTSITAEPHTAAICVYPKWIKLCKGELENTTVTVATVVNFPLGQDACEDVVTVTKQAVEDGVDEVDLVINYKKLIEDEASGAKEAEALVKAIKEACGDVCLKVIIEAGELKTEALVKSASRAAIRGGCDFIKTSTGKVPINATEENSRWMLEAITDAKNASEGNKVVGFKAAGGVKTLEATRTFLSMAEEIQGTDFVQKPTFRFGASSLLKVLRGACGGESVEAKEGY